MVNRLSVDKQQAVISGLVEGLSIRSLERMTAVHRDTITRLTVRGGNACADQLDVMMRDLPCQRIEVDEVWCFVGKKDDGTVTKVKPGLYEPVSLRLEGLTDD